jgi:hypothetical protein
MKSIAHILNSEYLRLKRTQEILEEHDRTSIMFSLQVNMHFTLYTLVSHLNIHHCFSYAYHQREKTLY